MPSIGDLANDLARWVYDQRLLVAVGSVVVLVVVFLVARRLGWFAAARRHPARFGVLVALVVVIGAPVGWYLASPIWIRTTLVEPEPVVAELPSSPVSSPVPAATPGVSPAAGATASSAGPTTAAASAPPAEPVILAKGMFHGTDEFHFGDGTATLVEIEPGHWHLRLDDFSVRNGPDLYVYLSPSADDYTDDAVELGKLKATDGAFGYDLPDGVDPSRFRSALIWCKQFSHLFAVAPFDAQG